MMKEGEPRKVKGCAKCKEVKSVEDFHKNSRLKDGLHSWCKLCVKNRQQKPEEVERRRRSAWLDCLKKKGITEEQYNETFEQQGGVCAICRRPEEGKKLAIDHDHACCPTQNACGECFRGLLCMKCNQGIGLLGDSPDTLNSALLYLKGIK